VIAYKEIKKNGEFVLPGFGKLVKQKKKARTGLTKDATEDQDSSQDCRQISFGQSRKGRGFGGKEVAKELSPEKAAAFGPERLHRTPESLLQFQIWLIMGLTWQAYGLGHLAKSIHGYYLGYRNFDNEMKTSFPGLGCRKAPPGC
jgi:hypothetical protein